jgi:hypothetical protein
VIPPGRGTPNATCIETGANGLADAPDPVGGDDVRRLLVGRAEANAPVIRCGLNEVAETFANNARAGGDDVQVVAVGAGCRSATSVAVDAGANGIAETRAQGVDLMIVSAARRLAVAIPKRKHLVSRRLKVAVVNREFGPTAPAARAFSLDVDDGDCPGGTVTEVDADARARGVQPTAAVGRRGKAKGTVVVTFEVGGVTTPARDVPLRCTVTVTVDSTETDGVDDASNTGNNSTRVELEVLDLNDL